MSACRRARRDTGGPYHRALGDRSTARARRRLGWRRRVVDRGDYAGTMAEGQSMEPSSSGGRGLSVFDGVLIVGGGLIALFVAFEVLGFIAGVLWFSGQADRGGGPDRPGGQAGLRRRS